MANPPVERVATIKLKLSLSSANVRPSTPKPGSSKSTTSSGMGKGKVADHGANGVASNGRDDPVAAGSSRQSFKGTPSSGRLTPTIKLKPSAASAAQINPVAVLSNGDHGIASTDDEPRGLPPSSMAESQFRRPADSPHRTVATPAQIPSVPSTPKSCSPSTPSTPSTSTTSSPRKHARTGKPIGRPKGSKTRPKPKFPIKKQFAPRPTAIPPRLLSSGPSTPHSMPPPPLPAMSPPSWHPTPPSSSDIAPVKTEPIDDEVDPLSLPLSPSAMDVSTPREHREALGMSSDQAADIARDRAQAKVNRLKKPLRELLERIMQELRKKDEYGLFTEPVDPDDFPGYLDIIGGEDKMMDLGTMWSKVHHGEYQTFDELEKDLRMMITSAQKFNPEGSVPNASAGKVLVHGLKHIERNRSLVRTPSPSPRASGSESGTPWRGQSMFSGRAGTMPPFSAQEYVPPELYIPEEMLLFPPNSSMAKAVGWNLNGGRRQYMRKHIRGREKFNGKWRHWDLDGTRDLAEMEDPDDLFESMKTTAGQTSRTIINWKGMRKEDVWWGFELGGPTGQPPIAPAPLPKPYRPRRRDLSTFEWGVYPEVDAETIVLSSKNDQHDLEVIADQLRPVKPRPPPPGLSSSSFVNVYDQPANRGPADLLREMVYGGIHGEAYVRSVESFVRGAMDSARSKNVEKGTANEGNNETLMLEEYVRESWHNGVLRSGPSSVIQNTLVELEALCKTLSDPSHPPLDDRQEAFLKVAKTETARQALKYLARPENPLDIAPLLVEQGDFLWAGVGGRSGVKEGLDWVGNEIARLSKEIQEEARVDDKSSLPNGKRKQGVEENGQNGLAVKKVKWETSPVVESTASSPLTQPPDSPPADPTSIPVDPDPVDRPAALKRLRLELIALTKFYPLTALRKMEKAKAEKLLPPNVRGLMSK